MLRPLLVLLGIACVTWLQFEFFPGHTYLVGDTQIYVPVLERLDSPGLLSRDLVATHPNVTYTIYDEVTLFLHEASKLDLRSALLIQQILFRAAALVGVFLLLRSMGLNAVFALAAAALVNLGAVLHGPGVSLIEPEPVPRGFAFALVLLGVGLFAQQKPLLAGLAGGLSFVYDARVAAPFWIVMILALIFDRRLRPMTRASIPILAVFALLLANLAQLQPGVAEPQSFFERLPLDLANIQQFANSSAWVSAWAGKDIWHYLAIEVIGLWATARIWPALNRRVRWFVIVLPIMGILSVPASFLLLEKLRWVLLPQIQPAQMLIFVVAFASISCVSAGLDAVRKTRYAESVAWFTIVFAMSLTTEIIGLRLTQLTVAFTLAATLTYLASHARTRRRDAIVLPAPLAAIFVFSFMNQPRFAVKVHEQSITQLADWANRNTWGGSMFLFPDAGRDTYPGTFRALSERPVWVDWQTGKQSNLFPTFAYEWLQRWNHMARIQDTLQSPIDYYVLKRIHRLPAIQPIYSTPHFLVYDGRELRDAGYRNRF